MADTAPSTTGHNGGIPPPPNKTADDSGGSSSSSSTSMANKQGVKKLLERYVHLMDLDLSLFTYEQSGAYECTATEMH